ncbi:protein SOSEKI 5 [Ricinus communis]|uniref:protein SOSEKI 5 n=1 Tax=Ricinus communis TaxID=3988 RepID=UPI00201A5F3E|nr:protein SOSEKI 5 [Ricinus communis]
MAVSSSSRGSRNAELLVNTVPRKFKDRDNDTTTIPWVEPMPKSQKRVPVVYYLSRNGQLEHPHFIEVPLSSPDGLYLRDVISRLNVLRGKGMASLYSWSSKRSYRNGFVWHDLAENDFIYPAHGHEYVLKGSELLDPSNRPLLPEPTPSSMSVKPLKPPEIHKSSSSEESDFPVITRRRNQSWSSIDLNEYKVYKTESFSESTRKLAADASTQTTDDKRRRRRLVKKDEEIEEKSQEPEVNREEIEISPPPSDSSPETLESLMKADGRLILGSGSNEESPNPTTENYGRIKASTVLMQLISCGSISFRDCGATAVKEQGLSLIGHYKGRLPRGGGSRVGTSKEFLNFGGVRLEDKEYFSGSLIETKKEEVPALKRSSSYNADRSSHLHLAEKEVEGARTKCIPRKPKAIPTKKETHIIESNVTSQLGSKRFEIQQVEDEAK